MIYFFYGPDTFRLQARVKELYAGLLLSSPSLELKNLLASDVTFVDFAREVSTISLFSTHRFIVVEGLISHGSKELQTKIVGWLSDPLSDGTVVVFKESASPDQRTAIFKALNKTLIEQYPLMTNFQVRQWLTSKASKLQLKLSPDVVGSLSKDFNGDLWRLSNELDKLAAYSNGKEVSGAVMQELVPGLLTDNIFQTIDALAQKKLSLASKLINQQLAFGTNEQQLISMFAYQFRNLALVTDLVRQGVSRDKLVSASGLHPYVLQKTLGMVSGFTTNKLNKIFQWLKRIDMATKQGKIAPEVGLDVLTAQIANL
ncbi:DNA polymerase III subunit delta [Patescibacteria group bacterium]|nr:DNA polymerase III subunit delta [Patescibacteria group bacterium]